MFKISVGKIIQNSFKKKYFAKSFTKEDIADLLKELKIILLNADVALAVVEDFLDKVADEVISKSNEFINKDDLEANLLKIIKANLTDILTAKNMNLNLQKNNTTKILFVGINGVGKTTSVAKLSFYLKQKLNKRVTNFSLDIYRPAAYDQLNKLSSRVGVVCHPPINNNIKESINKYLQPEYFSNNDVMIFDTFGLIANKNSHFEELEEIFNLIKPHEVIYVMDAMAGQEAIEIIKNFGDKVKINSLLISKSDSGAPMGAAFSINYLLNIPIKFLGHGEKIKDLMIFYPDRIANSILGGGDILTLAEKISEEISENTAENSMKKMMSGKFDLLDLITQIKEIKKIGSIKQIMKFLPHMSVNEGQFDNLEKEIKIWEILIQSMTLKEKRNPKLFKKDISRKNRVIRGSGRSVDELNKLLKKWSDGKKKIEEMSKKIGKTSKNLFNF